MRLPISPGQYDRHIEQQKSGLLERELELIWSVLRPISERFKIGSGSPEGVISARIGTIYLRTDGGAATSIYIKEADDGLASGWQAK